MISVGGEIAVRVFVKLESMVDSRKTRVEVAQHSIVSPKTITATPIPSGYAVETSKSSGQGLTCRIQSRTSPFFYSSTKARID